MLAYASSIPFSTTTAASVTTAAAATPAATATTATATITFLLFTTDKVKVNERHSTVVVTYSMGRTKRESKWSQKLKAHLEPATFDVFKIIH